MAVVGSLHRRAVSNHGAGKRRASKEARSVWKGGKTVKSYLSLPCVPPEWKGGTLATMVIGTIPFVFPQHGTRCEAVVHRRTTHEGKHCSLGAGRSACSSELASHSAAVRESLPHRDSRRQCASVRLAAA